MGFAHICELRSICRISIQCCIDSIFSGPTTIRNKRPMQTSEVLICPTPICTLPMPAARMRPCPIWPHAIQRNWTPSAPEMGPRFPMWNRDSLHARNSRVLSWTSITRRQAAGAYQSLPLPAHPTPPSTFPGASLAKAAIRTTRRWDSSRGIICISLHLPAPPCTSLHLQSPTSAPVAALITAPNLMPRGALWPHVLMSSCPPSGIVLPRRSLRAREEAGAASR